MEHTPPYIVRRCLNERQAMLLLQPIFSVKRDLPAAHELFLRLRTSDGKLISPGNFLPTAEQLGVLHEIDLLTLDVLRNVILPKVTAQTGRLAVNVALKSLMQRDYLHKLASPAWQGQLKLLIFEMHDHEILAHPEGEKVIDYLTGKHISLTVTSADPGVLELAHKLGIKGLKLDMGLFQKVPQSLGKAIEGAKKFGFESTVTSIESKEQHNLAVESGADCVQGYHYAKPQAAPVTFSLKSAAR